MTKSDAMFLLKCNKDKIPRNTVRSIYGQIAHGDVDTAVRGIRRFVAALDGDKINKKERSGGSGVGWHTEDVSYTLTAKDRHGVVYESNDMERGADCTDADKE